MSVNKRRLLETRRILTPNIEWLNLKPTGRPQRRVERLIAAILRAETRGKELSQDRRELGLRRLWQHNATGANVIAQSGGTHPEMKEIDKILRGYPGTRVLVFNSQDRLEEHFMPTRAASNRMKQSPVYQWEKATVDLVLRLLRQGWVDRLRRCSECHNWYFAVTQHQQHCSKQCRQKLASQSDVFKQKRAEYMRQYRRDERDRAERARRRVR